MVVIKKVSGDVGVQSLRFLTLLLPLTVTVIFCHVMSSNVLCYYILNIVVVAIVIVSTAIVAVVVVRQNPRPPHTNQHSQTQNLPILFWQKCAGHPPRPRKFALAQPPREPHLFHGRARASILPPRLGLVEQCNLGIRGSR